MKLVTLILELLRRLLDFLKQKKINDESEKGREDPANAFAEHFNGRVQHPDEQSSTDEAGTESDRSGE
ncbi:MAG: hypothetical protein OQK78_12365 [Gammaproteobacteria bacterium]|nr:hypothetical protein [Gammaproteobacteria bacterium]MCW8887966.1 hypothetical protein [Gammaproteobacteria bacterium]MCW8983143.1 hypothetical protein [Gammaproteobacteria bacterium]